MLANDICQLVLMVTIRVFRSTWLATYKFDLLERIDILESKLRDQQDEWKNLRRDLHPTESVSRYVQLEAFAKIGRRLLWRENHWAGFAVNGRDGLVKVRDAGVYMMSAIISTSSRYGGNDTQLLVNGIIVQSVSSNSSYCDGSNKNTSLSFTTALKEGDEVAVLCDCDLGSTSYLSIVKVGI